MQLGCNRLRLTDQWLDCCINYPFIMDTPSLVHINTSFNNYCFAQPSPGVVLDQTLEIQNWAEFPTSTVTHTAHAA